MAVSFFFINITRGRTVLRHLDGIFFSNFFQLLPTKSRGAIHRSQHSSFRLRIFMISYLVHFPQLTGGVFFESEFRDFRIRFLRSQVVGQLMDGHVRHGAHSYELIFLILDLTRGCVVFPMKHNQVNVVTYALHCTNENKTLTSRRRSLKTITDDRNPMSSKREDVVATENQWRKNPCSLLKCRTSFLCRTSLVSALIDQIIKAIICSVVSYSVLLGFSRSNTS